MHKHTQTYTNIHKHSQTFTNIHIHTHTYTYIHIHTHTYTYTYIHRQTQTDTDRHRQTQTDTDRHRQTQTDTYMHIRTQRGTRAVPHSRTQHVTHVFTTHMGLHCSRVCRLFRCSLGAPTGGLLLPHSFVVSATLRRPGTLKGKEATRYYHCLSMVYRELTGQVSSRRHEISLAVSGFTKREFSVIMSFGSVRPGILPMIPLQSLATDVASCEVAEESVIRRLQNTSSWTGSEAECRDAVCLSCSK